MKSTKYEVVIEKYAERHFISKFKKKYKGSWDLTLNTLIEEFEKIDVLFLKSIAEYITDKNANLVICKTEFRVHGTKKSRHGSGNRCIVAVHKDTFVVNVLLVYHKNHLSGKNETASWKQLIKENYPEYSSLL